MKEKENSKRWDEVEEWRNFMRKKFFIVPILIIWLLFMVLMIENSADGQWFVEDVEKIGELNLAKYYEQILVVAVKDDETILCFYQKEPSGEWKLELETQAQIGKNGLGKHREGDGKTPVGVFSFTDAFGILKNPGTKIPYIQVDKNHYWIDDAKSEYYNQFIDSEEVIKDWNSAEHICEYGEAYHYVMATSYNKTGIAGVGSAIFLHCMT